MSDHRFPDRGSGRRPLPGRDERARDEEFVSGVLERTTGSPCRRAAELLPDLNDGALADLDRQLVQAHLEHCPGCRALAVTLGWLDPLLPKMALLEPGPGFTERVLARTSGAAPGLAAGPVLAVGGFGPAGLMDRLGRWWEGQILRPVFPLQMAYTATVLLVVLAGTPLSPFREAPGRLLQTVQAGPGSVPLVEEAVGRLVDSVAGNTADWVAGRTGPAYRSVRSGVTGLWREADEARRGSLERTGPEARLMKAHLGALVRDLGERRLGEASYDLHQSLKAGRRAWSAWWEEGPTNGSPDSKTNSESGTD